MQSGQCSSPPTSAEYARIKALDVEDFADDFLEFDELRFSFGQVIVRHVNLA